MILIVGGREQGKLTFACSLSGAPAEPFLPSMAADGSCDSFEKAENAPVICHLEAYIRRMMEDGRDPAEWIDRLIAERQDILVIADEIGAGIVPADPFEREYRETAGRLCQRLAAASESVYRVICGLGMKIK